MVLSSLNHLGNKSDKKSKEEDTKEEEATPVMESQLLDVGALTVEELLDELQKRMTASTDTKLKRQLSRIVERKTLPAKRRGFTQKAKINGQAIS
jgi:ribonucleoside-diphosphate reductase alpha chain